MDRCMTGFLVGFLAGGEYVLVGELHTNFVARLWMNVELCVCVSEWILLGNWILP